ncbi:hypothetical protein BGZ63DRAFT_195533 [Mariannaea sp. PMI_226]|nr:hypothetical protein BGZ63DRAFT_195533 [Mariannaea sp. PMI_226]
MPGLPIKTDAARLQCSTCEKTYARVSHLRRHEATHNNDRLITCPSCSKAFVRIDVARRHMRSCVEDGDSIILPTARRGKKPRACDRCSQGKVSCDLETPCSRCRVSGLSCSYLRVDAHAATSATTTTITTNTSTTTKTSPGAEISWLLRMTDPQAVGTEDAISHDIRNDELTSDEAWDVPAPLDLQGAKSLLEDEAFPWGPAAWLTDDPILGLEFGTERMDIDQSSTFHSALLKARMDEIISEMAKTHEQMRRDFPNECGEFDISLARKVFTTYNLEHFVWVYFHRVHPYHPILHPPTFDCEKASLPLLLAIFHYGALFSAPIDDAMSARSFFHAAEEYIFNHRDMRQLLLSGRATEPCSRTTLEVLQAALSILLIQNSKNDETVRRRIRIEKLPRFNAAIRYSGAFRAKHQVDVTEYVASTWEQFIDAELRIRLAHYTQLNNNFMAGCFNAPAQAYLCEMVGDMPSRRELFDAPNPQAFVEQALLEPAGPRLQSLAKSISALMSDSWPGPTDEMYKRMTPDNLFIHLVAIGLMIVVSRTNCLFPTSSRTLILACMRWKSLWDAVTKRDGKPPQHGFIKHAMEMWAFSLVVINVQRSGETSSDYMTNIALDSFESVNEFMNRYKDGLNRSPAR